MTTAQLHALARQAGWPEPPVADATPLYTVDRRKTWAVTGDTVIEDERWDPEHRDDHALLLYLSFPRKEHDQLGWAEQHVVAISTSDLPCGQAAAPTFAAAVTLAACRALGVENA